MQIKTCLLIGTLSQQAPRFLPESIKTPMCDTRSIFSLPKFCFLVPDGKVGCLKLAEYFFFLFYVKNRKDVFPLAENVELT